MHAKTNESTREPPADDFHYDPTLLEGKVLALVNFEEGPELASLIVTTSRSGAGIVLNLNDLRSVTYVVVNDVNGPVDPAVTARVPTSIPILSVRWLVDTIMFGHLLNVEPYQSGARHQPDASDKPALASGMYYTIKAIDPVDGDLFRGRRLYIHSDLPSRMRERFVEVITAAGGTVLDTLPPANCGARLDACVFRYAQSETFLAAMSAGHVVGSMHWLFDLVRTGTWTDPRASALHFPYPHRRPGYIENAVVCITEFVGPTRDYIKEMIALLGMRHNSTMSTISTHLIAGRAAGEKFTRAHSPKWPAIHIVNYAWLEDSLFSGSLAPTTSERYMWFPPPTADPAVPVGATRVPSATVARVVAEARRIVDKTALRRQRGLDALKDAQGHLAADESAPLVERRAKEKTSRALNAQLDVLDTFSATERAAIFQTWEDKDDDFHGSDPESPPDDEGGAAADDTMQLDTSSSSTLVPPPQQKQKERSRPVTPAVNGDAASMDVDDVTPRAQKQPPAPAPVTRVAAAGSANPRIRPRTVARSEAASASASSKVQRLTDEVIDLTMEDETDARPAKRPRTVGPAAVAPPPARDPPAPQPSASKPQPAAPSAPVARPVVPAQTPAPAARPATDRVPSSVGTSGAPTPHTAGRQPSASTAAPHVATPSQPQQQPPIARPRIMVSQGFVGPGLRKLLEEIGCTITHKVELHTTHLATRRVACTERFLVAMLTVQHIASTEWLVAMAKVKQIIDAAPFLLRDKEYETRTGRTLHQTMQILQREPFLRGVALSMADPFVMSEAALGNIANASGATIVPYNDIPLHATLPTILLTHADRVAEYAAACREFPHVHVAEVEALTESILDASLARLFAGVPPTFPLPDRARLMPPARPS
ncbi:regulator of Ty1 Transposition [Blastocladiella emersonii ATCC 22665]|nr:regulator of Ty1 Transposition [Blastocladiella emersonii ATCC 22665]